MKWNRGDTKIMKAEHKSRISEFILIGLIAFILVVSSLFFIPYEAVTYDQISTIKLGAPINFIVQHTSLTPDISEFPMKLTFLSPWDNPTEIVFKNFLFSLLIIWMILYSVFRLIKFKRKGIGLHRKSHAQS